MREKDEQQLSPKALDTLAVIGWYGMRRLRPSCPVCHEPVGNYETLVVLQGDTSSYCTMAVLTGTPNRPREVTERQRIEWLCQCGTNVEMTVTLPSTDRPTQEPITVFDQGVAITCAAGLHSMEEMRKLSRADPS